MNDTITMGCIYDDNRNTTRTLTKLEELLDKIDGRQGLVIGGDYNVIVNPLLDQHGYDTPHLRTKAVKHHNEWKASGTQDYLKYARWTRHFKPVLRDQTLVSTSCPSESGNASRL